MKRPVVIIGGGLAGIAAAIRLVDSDFTPIIIESRKRLGGRATSLVDPRSGYTIDNCQHVLLGCCTNLMDLYQRISVLDLIEWHPSLFWTNGKGHIDTMKSNWLPAPLHLRSSFKRMEIFSSEDKTHISRAMFRMLRLGTRGRMRWRNRTFADYLIECGQPARLVQRFWNTIIVSACNLDVQRVSAYYALQVLQEGFLANRWSYTMGLSSVPLVELYDPAVELIQAAGGMVRLSCSAKAIAFDGKRATGVVTDDDMIECAAVISALPPDRLEKLVSDTLRRCDRRLQRLDEIQYSPILGVHLRFNQEIMKLPHLVLIDAPNGLQWLFNKGVDANGQQHIHAVISAADSWMDLDEEEIVSRVVEDVEFALPNSKGLRPVDARSIKEKRATFAATPNVDELRPSAAPHFASGSGVPNLYLAGDWCDTGWPATMEGAVRSGYAAAAAILNEELVVEDVPSSLLSRILGLR